MRRELFEAAMRKVFGVGRTPREVVAEIDKFAREKGIDETRIAVSVGKFWGRLFKELEVEAAKR